MLLAGAGSAAVLGGALASQFIGGLAPCPLCIWQRWPHLAAVVLAVLGVALLARWHRPLAGLGALAMLVGAGLGLYHTGIERGWWQGPDTCVGASDVGALSADELMAQIMAAPLVRCDEVVWEFLGLSMASWNALASLALAGLWLMAIRRQDSSSASQ
ncbi:MAG TPA: disulfide bond formation protein B [Thermohalobaculum sp.]|nr:disulfide bond formation protein B [Thermohalobaculum sp.]